MWLPVLMKPVIYKFRKGFTLIEILVVLTIIGILVGLSLTAFYGSRKTARDGKRKADLEQIRSGLEMCRTDTGSYVVGSSLPGTCSTYLTSMPADPLSPTSVYAYSGVANTYTLCARLEAGSGTVSGCGSCGSSGACNYKVTQP